MFERKAQTYRRFLLTSLLALIITTMLGQKVGQECFPEKKTDKMVYDDASILSQQEWQMLEKKLEEFVIRTSNEISVVIVPDLCGMEKAQFATELGELWGIGQAKEDNGILVLVKPKTIDSRGEVFIAVGRGLEGIIPDATVFMIVTNEMIPSFQQQDMAGGINKAVDILMALAQGEYDSTDYAARYHNKSDDTIPWAALIFILFIILLVLTTRAFQVRKYARLNNMEFWAAWMLLNSTSQTHSSSWDDFRRGRGGFGGFGGGGGRRGGGFGGFGGGGSFGGGGAGGSW